eukprot:m.44482 g.44482  ORF g.44482 m.44482 type:complete len:155 (+) comp10611_c0_seq5:129-593(+)
MSHRMDAKMETILNENKARDLKNGNPDILYHGTDKVDYSTTLHAEYETKKEDATGHQGIRQRLREQRAREKAMKKLAQTDKQMMKRAQQVDEGDDPLSEGKQTGRLVSSKEYLASLHHPKGEVSYVNDKSKTYWAKDGNENFGRTQTVTKQGEQ